jgi:Protein of unknown function (DUF1572)
MPTIRFDFPRQFVEQARHSLLEVHLPRVERCLKTLSEDDLWWRPNAASNAAGNLALHLEGNVRQWIISGIANAPDERQRDQEFAERGPVGRRVLLARLKSTASEAGSIIEDLTTHDLSSLYRIQDFSVRGYAAVGHVVEHFAYHTGQIVFITKLRTGHDLDFTRLPSSGPTESRKPAGSLPAL